MNKLQAAALMLATAAVILSTATIGGRGANARKITHANTLKEQIELETPENDNNSFFITAGAAAALNIPPTTDIVEVAPEITPEPPVNIYNFTDAEKEALAKIAQAEAGTEGIEGKARVMNVILNRVDSETFPDSIEGTIKEPGQFTTVKNGRYDAALPDDECYKAVELIQTGHDNSEGALYFERSSNGDTWHSRNLEKVNEYKNHTFYK